MKVVFIVILYVGWKFSLRVFPRSFKLIKVFGHTPTVAGSLRGAEEKRSSSSWPKMPPACFLASVLGLETDFVVLSCWGSLGYVIKRMKKQQ